MHERIDGTGYPEGLKNDEIHEYARIVALADVYDALTHLRPHRGPVESPGAVRELLAMASSGIFELRIVKVFINRIGLYPVGIWVELNTNEIGKVVSANHDYPLRPKVNAIFGPDKQRLAQMKFIDLSKMATAYIKRSVKLQDLNLKFE